MIKTLKHKHNQESLMNLNYEKLIDTIKKDAKYSKIAAKRWSMFILQYKEINPIFTDKLQKFKLTKTEFRLAIFTFSKLQNSEIAEILSINIETVYIQRQRLAKKLGLKSVKEIESFLNNL